jgi:hypothetical protein
MAPVPEGAQRSPDGYYWWDGTTWQEIPEDERTAPSSADPAASDPAAASAGSSDVSHDELAQITTVEQLDDRSKPYFQPDYDKVPDDSSLAEGSDVLSDEPAAGVS